MRPNDLSAPEPHPTRREIRRHAFCDDALGESDATEVAERIAAGEISAVEAIHAAIARARSIQPRLYPLQVTDFERAIRTAAAPKRGAFAGVPTAVKDNCAVRGLPTGFGSASYRPGRARRNGDFIDQFLATGAIPIGKSRLPEFGLDATTEFGHAEPVRNPWDPTYSAGGSSGGAAALVAAGVLPFAHGNDGAGSIRIPAAACGLVGLKPTRGRTVAELNERRMPIRIVSQGVLTRTVRDTARFYAAAETYRRNQRLPPIGSVTAPGVRRLRIGLIVDSLPGIHTDAETCASVLATADLLTELGHRVEPAELPVGADFLGDFTLYWAMLTSLLLLQGRRAFGTSFDRERTENLTRGLAVIYRRRARETPAALYRLRQVRHAYAAMFDRHDVVLSPVLAHTTPELGYLSPAIDADTLMDRLIRYVAFTPLNNAAGSPALALPLHRTVNGLPLASHFSARHGDERTLLQLGYELEAARPWARIQDPDQPGNT